MNTEMDYWITVVRQILLTLVVAAFPRSNIKNGYNRDGSGVLAASNSVCPKPCFCNSVNRIVFCSRRGLSQIPEGVPEGTLQLNLNGNMFRSRTIQRSNISRYIHLEHLYMSDCGVQKIEVDAFVDLLQLKWLDLSDNEITIIESSTFQGLNLQNLFLNGNRKIHLLDTSFNGLIATGLYLHDCGLRSIKPAILAFLNGTLTNLWMNSNHLTRLDQSFRDLFRSISHLRLGANPLRCNCEAIWLKEFYDTNSELFSGAEAPSCASPPDLKGKHFNELSLFDFRCKTPAFRNIDALFDSNRYRLRCSATGDPAPSLYWIQPSGKAIRFDPVQSDTDAQSESHTEGVLLLENHTVRRSSDMSGMYICIAANEAGNATLTINVTWPSLTSSSNNLSNDVKLTTNDVIFRPPVTSTQALNENGYVVLDRIKLEEGLWKDSEKSEEQLVELDDEEGRFTLVEMILAVVGTHVFTVALALLLVPLYHWRFGHQKNSTDKQIIEQQQQQQQQQQTIVEELQRQFIIQQPQPHQLKSVHGYHNGSTLLHDTLQSDSPYSNSSINHDSNELYYDPSAPLTLRR